MARTPYGRWARKASPVLSSFQSSQYSALSTSYLVHVYLLCMGPILGWTPPVFQELLFQAVLPPTPWSSLTFSLFPTSAPQARLQPFAS